MHKHSLETKKPGLEDRAFGVAGAKNRNRTYDLRVTSALLYRLSYFGAGIVRLNYLLMHLLQYNHPDLA